MPTNPIFSIIIPCFNTALFLKRNIQELIKQGGMLNCIELIFVNDASTDSTEKILNEIQNTINQFNQILIINNTINSGVSSSRNKGLSKAKGKYILFLDADDRFNNNLFNELNILLTTQPELDLISFSLQREGGANKQTKSYSNIKFDRTVFSGTEFTKLFLSKKIAQHVCSIAIRRQFLIDNNIKFNENSSLGEDIAFQIKCMSLSKQVLYLAKDYFHYNYNPDSVTNRKYTEKHLSCTQNYPDLHQFFIDHNKNDLLPFLNFYYQYLFFYELRFFLRSGSSILIDTYIKSDTVLLTDFTPSFSRPVFILVILKTLYKLCPKILFKFLKNK